MRLTRQIHFIICCALLAAALIFHDRLGSLGLIPLTPLFILGLIPAILSIWSGRNLRDFLGLRRPRLQIFSWIGLIVLILALALFVFVAARTQTVGNYYDQFLNSASQLARLSSWVLFAFASCVVTEFFFRGFWLMGSTSMGMKAFPAILIVCAAEVVFHWMKPWPEIFGMGLLSIFLSFLSLKLRSIWPAFFIHAGIELSFAIAVATL